MELASLVDRTKSPLGILTRNFGLYYTMKHIYIYKYYQIYNHIYMKFIWRHLDQLEIGSTKRRN